MRIVEMLSSAESREFYLGLYGPGLLAGLAVVVMCGLLSVLVVVKRLGFVGQGVSHSAFGGIGVAAMLAAIGLMPAGEAGQAVQLGIVVLFCLGAAVGMGAVSSRREVSEDTAIGLFLVGSMALGAVLVQVARGIAERGGAGVTETERVERVEGGDDALRALIHRVVAGGTAPLVTSRRNRWQHLPGHTEAGVGLRLLPRRGDGRLHVAHG